MQKAVVLVLLGVFLISIVSGLGENETSRGFECLNKQVEKAPALSFEDAVFSLIALSDNAEKQTKLKEKLMAFSQNDGECWPKGGCKIKESAMALLALNHIRADTEKVENYLLKQNGSTADLDWFLEIDSASETICKISYDNANNSINIGADKKINQNAGGCLSLANNNYWFKISQNCLGKEFTITCDKDFVSSVFFQRRGADVFHLPSATNSGAAKSFTKHTANSLCFKEGGSCVYEGSLWAVLALKKTVDVSDFLPFISSLAETNGKFGPDVFLYLFTGDEEHYTQLTQLQHPNGFWDFGAGFGRFYDTALALLALQGVTVSSSVDSAKNFLASTQQASGCWNNDNIRDTAFILQAVSPKDAISLLNPTDTDACSDFNFHCLSAGECENVKGNIKKGFYCSGVKVCCDKPGKKETCDEKGGIACRSGETCEGSQVAASDIANCCIGSCVEKSEETNACENAGNKCKSSCASGEKESLLECSGSSVCCETTSGKSYFWVWFLLVLIALVIAAIIFRNNLRLWIFQLKNKFSKSGGISVSRPIVPPSAPPSAPPGLPRRQQFVQRGAPARVAVRPTIQKPGLDKDLEETMKKLKEIGQ